MSESLLITVIADDRPGVVQLLSDAIKLHDGNWLESSLSRLGGEFAGLIRVKVAADKKADLEKALADLHEHGINVFNRASTYQGIDLRNVTRLSVIGNDRPGIVEELSTVLAKHNINVEHLNTRCEAAAMAGDMMFIADIQAYLPDNMLQHDLQELLENLSDDLVVEYDDESNCN